MKNIKLYSPQDIDQLKQTITTYKKTLATLKKGPSLEDCLVIKAEFDAFKRQLARLEYSKNEEGFERVPFNEYEEQVKQMSIQIKEIHQYIEEINQEILAIFKHMIAQTEINVNSVSHSPTMQDEEILKPEEEEIPTPSPILKKQSTFMQLQLIAGKVNVPQTQSVATVKEEPMPTTSDSIQFNQPYFQLTSIPPSEMYNGLFKNTSREPALQFRNALEIQVDTTGGPGTSSSPATDNQPNSSQQSESTTIRDHTIDSLTTQSPTQNNQEQEAIQSTSITQETSTIHPEPLETIAFTNSIPTVDSSQVQPATSHTSPLEANTSTDPLLILDSLQHQPTTSHTSPLETIPSTDSLPIMDSSQQTSPTSHTQIHVTITPPPLETTEASPSLQEEMTVPETTQIAISQDEVNQMINEIDNSSTPSAYADSFEEKDIKKEKGNFFFNLFRKRN